MIESLLYSSNASVVNHPTSETKYLFLNDFRKRLLDHFNYRYLLVRTNDMLEIIDWNKFGHYLQKNNIIVFSINSISVFIIWEYIFSPQSGGHNDNNSSNLQVTARWMDTSDGSGNWARCCLVVTGDGALLIGTRQNRSEAWARWALIRWLATRARVQETKKPRKR